MPWTKYVNILPLLFKLHWKWFEVMMNYSLSRQLNWFNHHIHSIGISTEINSKCWCFARVSVTVHPLHNVLTVDPRRKFINQHNSWPNTVICSEQILAPIRQNDTRRFLTGKPFRSFPFHVMILHLPRPGVCPTFALDNSSHLQYLQGGTNKAKEGI